MSDTNKQCTACDLGHGNLNGIVDSLMNQSRICSGMRTKSQKPLPSQKEIIEIVELLRSIIFPKCFGPEHVDSSSIRYHIGATLDRVYHILQEQLSRGYCFQCDGLKETCGECEERAENAANSFLETVPDIASKMNMDVHETYLGDPAAIDEDEVIFCYPGIKATLYYRIAHELYKLGSPIISRIITEYAHNTTGIDIHPGANIKGGLTIDHGTGVVIGETCEIGHKVKIFQGVTLGAKSFPLDDDGNPIKGIKRHPKLEDNVIIYSGATILGDVVIGKNSVIGGNVWLTESIPPGSKVLQQHYQSEIFENGSGI